MTPDPYRVWSKRGFDKALQTWRVALHCWDPAGESTSGLDGLVELTGRSVLSSPSKNSETVVAVAVHGDDNDLVDYDDDGDDGDDVL